MQISATVINQNGQHTTTVRTNVSERPVAIPAKTQGKGSSVNGGELLFLALATCYCNDIYREAAERNIEVTAVEVEVTGSFGGKGDAATNIQYRASVRANASEAEVLDLIRHTDAVAEIHNTLRQGATVTLTDGKAL